MVKEATDLGELTITLNYVIDAGGFHEEGKAPFLHHIDALGVVFREDTLMLPRVHEVPHSSVGGMVR